MLRVGTAATQMLLIGSMSARAQLRQKLLPFLPHRLLSKANAAKTAAAAATSAAEAPHPLPKCYEPGYLDIKPDYPAMGQFQLSLTCYEYPRLERFSAYAQSLLRKQFKLDAEQCEVVGWPLRRTAVDLYQPDSVKVSDSFELNTYRRVIVLEGLPAVEIGLVLNILSQNLPEGVEMTVQRVTEEDTEFRYVPDLEIQELKKQVEMGKSGKYSL